nr:MAG TPA: hypothetical protein [Caudoviricetes sp.]
MTINSSVLTATRELLTSRHDKSAWDRGVTAYALDLLDAFTDDAAAELDRSALLNGASSWTEYSYGGSALIYDGDIAERLCTPSELKRKRGGELQPSSRELWLDVQARALNQACGRLLRAYRAALRSDPA